jgi:hypothetical protein
MCPVCLTSLAVTVAASTGAGGAVTALALRIRRSLTRNRAPRSQPRPREEAHELVEANRHP